MAVVRPELQAPNGEPAKPQEGRGVAGEVWESGKAVGEVHVHSDVAIELAWRYIRDEEGITSEQLLEKLKQLGELPSLPAKLRDTPRDTLAMYADQGRKYYKECYPKSQKECAQYFGNCSQATMERYVGAFRAICEVVGIRPEKLKDHL
jgi:hypothetical protein